VGPTLILRIRFPHFRDNGFSEEGFSFLPTLVGAKDSKEFPKWLALTDCIPKRGSTPGTFHGSLEGNQYLEVCCLGWV